MEITYQKLLETAAAYRTNLSRMKTALDIASSNIDRSKSVWEGTSAEELRAKYTILKQKFDDFFQAVERFAKFLDNTADGYKGLEAKITQAADDIFQG